MKTKVTQCAPTSTSLPSHRLTKNASAVKAANVHLATAVTMLRPAIMQNRRRSARRRRRSWASSRNRAILWYCSWLLRTGALALSNPQAGDAAGEERQERQEIGCLHPG